MRRPRRLHRAQRQLGKLFLFDEPTTGLHFDDVAKLLRAFAKLLAAGHSLLVIEHNLDVMRASRLDHRPWARGRRSRRQHRVRRHARRGARLRGLVHRAARSSAYERRAGGRAPAVPAVADTQPAYARGNGDDANAIVIHSAREHNLKNVDVRIPRDGSR